MAIFASGMKTKASDILKYTIGALIAGALLWLALRNVQWKLVVEGLEHCKWGFILLMLAANLASLALRTIRWRLLVKPVAPGERPGTIFNAYCIGNMFNSLLPGSGELIRCGFIRSSEASYQKVLGTVLTERIWDAISIVILVIIALLAGSGEFASFCHQRIWMPMANGFSTKWWIIPAALLLIAVLVLLFRKFKARSAFLQKVGHFFSGLWDGFLSFRNMEGKGTFLLLTVGIWGLYWFGMHCVLWAMPELCHLQATDSLMLTAVGNLASVVPAPGSIGAYHFLIAAAISQIYNATWETGLLYAVLNHEPILISHLILGAVCYILEKASKKRNGRSSVKKD